MSYHIYHTEGFVIDSVDTGEANKLLTLYTADLGLVMAAAQSVRSMASKLRPSIQDLSFASLALVRGKEVWRLTNARKLISLFDRRVPLLGRVVMARTLALVKRLVRGESRNQELFALLSGLSSVCFSERKLLLDKEKAEGLELIAALRILASLGYGTSERELEIFTQMNIHDEDVEHKGTRFGPDLIERMTPDIRKRARLEVNRALRESHL